MTELDRQTERVRTKRPDLVARPGLLAGVLRIVPRGGSWDLDNDAHDESTDLRDGRVALSEDGTVASWSIYGPNPENGAFGGPGAGDRALDAVLERIKAPEVTHG